MIEPEQPAEHAVGKETVRQSIALSYVKAWQKLPPGPGDLLASLLPVLVARDPGEALEIRLGPVVPGDACPDARRKEWKALKKTVRAVHRSKVRHLWYRLNPETKEEHLCSADLVWTTEVRIDPVAREVELVFWDRLAEYLPEILGPISEFGTRPLPSRATPAPNEGLTAYFHDRQP